MATTVVVSATVKDFEVPQGTKQGQYEFVVTDSQLNVVGDQKVDTPTASFLVDAAGDYVASVQLLDSNGGPLGSKVQASFTVPTPPTTHVSVPDVVTVTLS